MLLIFFIIIIMIMMTTGVVDIYLEARRTYQHRLLFNNCLTCMRLYFFSTIYLSIYLFHRHRICIYSYVPRAYPFIHFFLTSPIFQQNKTPISLNANGNYQAPRNSRRCVPKYLPL